MQYSFIKKTCSTNRIYVILANIFNDFRASSILISDTMTRPSNVYSLLSLI